MDTKYLNYIVEIAEQRNLTRAAGSLYISASSLSQYLTKLEEEIGTPLFYRRHTEMVPTVAGEIYIEGARKAIALKQDIYRNIADLSGGGVMSIGVTSQWSISMVMKILPRLKENYPQMSFEISEYRKNVIKRKLSAGKLDFALLSVGDEDDYAFADHVTLLDREEILFSVNKDHEIFLEKAFPDDRISLKEIKQYFGRAQYVLCNESSAHGVASNKILRAADIVPNVLCTLNTAPPAARMVDSGLGVSFLPRCCISGMENIRGFSVGNGYFRKNILAFRRDLVMGEAENTFVSLVERYKKDVII